MALLRLRHLRPTAYDSDEEFRAIEEIWQRALDELILPDIERFTRILDPDEAPAHLLPYMLYEAGWTLPLPLPEAQLRRLAKEVPRLFRLAGTRPAIEAAVRLFTAAADPQAAADIYRVPGERWFYIRLPVGIVAAVDIALMERVVEIFNKANVGFATAWISRETFRLQHVRAGPSVQVGRAAYPRPIPLLGTGHLVLNGGPRLSGAWRLGPVEKLNGSQVLETGGLVHEATFRMGTLGVLGAGVPLGAGPPVQEHYLLDGHLHLDGGAPTPTLGGFGSLPLQEERTRLDGSLRVGPVVLRHGGGWLTWQNERVVARGLFR